MLLGGKNKEESQRYADKAAAQGKSKSPPADPITLKGGKVADDLVEFHHAELDADNRQFMAEEEAAEQSKERAKEIGSLIRRNYAELASQRAEGGKRIEVEQEESPEMPIQVLHRPPAQPTEVHV